MADLTGIVIPAGGPRLVTNLLVTLKVRRGGGGPLHRTAPHCRAQRQAAHGDGRLISLPACFLPACFLPACFLPACFLPACPLPAYGVGRLTRLPPPCLPSPQVLREHHKSTLPVEVMWQGAGEMDNKTWGSINSTFTPIRGVDITTFPHPVPGMHRK